MSAIKLRNGEEKEGENATGGYHRVTLTSFFEDLPRGFIIPFTVAFIKGRMIDYRAFNRFARQGVVGDGAFNGSAFTVFDFSPLFAVFSWCCWPTKYFHVAKR